MTDYEIIEMFFNISGERYCLVIVSLCQFETVLYPIADCNACKDIRERSTCCFKNLSDIKVQFLSFMFISNRGKIVQL